MGKSLVIVESPTKARTIEKYLPKGYVVRSSMGHVRDLPKSKSEIPQKYRDEPWAEISVNYEDAFQPIYILSRGKKKVIDELKKELRDADELILATDEDREGESIAWHLAQLLKPKVPMRRMVFHEITPEAIQAALNETRDIDENLVRAQETRRILDRLVGYTVSPLLWKKIGGQLSAGRVQSAAVKLLVDRERERLRFRTGSFWDLRATLARQDTSFDARLYAVAGTRIATGKDFDEQTGRLKKGVDALLLDEQEARKLADRLQQSDWTVLEVREKPETRRPAPPFITSTLQQEANRKLNFSARRTMQIAQDLYQRGFITYMRTDSPVLSDQAIRAARHWVETEYGRDYLSPKPRQFRPKSATNAQEAHEAIRPAGERFKAPRETGLTGDELKLYELIWKRTVASQMADAKQTQITVRIQAGDAEFRASGKRIDFPGFFRAYVEGSDDPDAALEDQEKPLPPLAPGDAVELRALEAVAHETRPPARYTEASLVRALEEKGIGRPSTYATILGTIIDRGYVRTEGKALVPTLKAFAVTQLLEQHFPELVDLDFTRDMEDVLDRIAAGKADWLPYLHEFYNGPSGLRTIASQREAEIDVQQARQIELPDLAPHEVRIGKFGAYAVVYLDEGETVNVNLPDELSPDQLTPEFLRELAEQKTSGPTELGRDPETGEPVLLLNGRFGWFVQLGEAGDDNPKPKRQSLPRDMSPEDVDLDTALKLLSLPRDLGAHPEGGRVITTYGPHGPYVAHVKEDGTREFRSLPKESTPLDVTFDEAMELLRQPKKRGRANAQVLRELGAHPEDGKPVELREGRYGPYVRHGKVNASLPKGQDPDKVTLEQAVELLAAKATRSAEKSGKRGKKGNTRKKSS